MNLDTLLATTTGSMVNELRQVHHPERGSMMEVLHYEAKANPFKVARACLRQVCEEMDGVNPDEWEVVELRLNEYDHVSSVIIREVSAVDRLAKLA